MSKINQISVYHQVVKKFFPNPIFFILIFFIGGNLFKVIHLTSFRVFLPKFMPIERRSFFRSSARDSLHCSCYLQVKSVEQVSLVQRCLRDMMRTLRTRPGSAYFANRVLILLYLEIRPDHIRIWPDHISQLEPIR